MKVVIINKYSNKGGAAIASKRLYEALKENKNIEVNFLTQETTSNIFKSTTNNFLKKKLNFLKFALERLLIHKNIKNKENLFFFDSASFGEDITKHHLIKEADIIHLHWTNFGYLSLNSLKKIFALNKPIFWTLHDMWLLTGGCFHSRGCQQYQTECIKCPFLKDKSKLAKKTFQKKQQIFKIQQPNTIAISNWSMSNIEKSSLISKKSIVIGNPIDTNFYTSRNKTETKLKLNLNKQKLHIGFIAFNISNKYKGGQFLVNSLKIIENKNQKLYDNIELIAIGRVKDKDFFPKNFNIKFTGYIDDEKIMRDYYNAIDVFVLPSLEENLPLVIQEAMSCETPVVAFNTGGISDLIDHKINGYLAIYKDEEDLSSGIEYILSDAHNKKAISINARKKIIENFSYKIISTKIIEQYQKILSIHK